ncbi:hypothetical protein [Fictibacillus gelatini]|uniref:hypothetical protein n=1 Tax=Fictibacillus gelatini TaxID=225985 RepID=UPI00041CBF8F|nr:hypothetical protein [Fictibacillus gelatini]
MTGEIRFMKGILQPSTYFEFFRQVTAVKGFLLQFTVLLAVNAVVTGIAYYISFESFLQLPMMEHVKITNGQKDALHLFLALGGTIVGFLLPIFYITAITLLFLFFFREIGFKKLFYIQSVVYSIFIVANVFKLPFMAVTKTNEVMSPLGLGVLSHFFTENAFINALFGSLTIFLIWGIYVTYIALRWMSFKSKRYVLAVLFTIYGGYVLISSLFAALSNGQIS